jgi:acetyl-CoA carboxylase biotin carboxyl carrier protein
MFSPEEFEKTRQLLELFGTNKLSELCVSEINGFSVEIVASSPAISQQAPIVVSPASASQPKVSSSQLVNSASAPMESMLNSLNSPMVGIFYAAGAPGDPPFVNVGDVVAVGQTIGLIEAMKVFSEIPSESAGRIVEIVAVSGALVQQSEPLFRIEPV